MKLNAAYNEIRTAPWRDDVIEEVGGITFLPIKNLQWSGSDNDFYFAVNEIGGLRRNWWRASEVQTARILRDGKQIYPEEEVTLDYINKLCDEQEYPKAIRMLAVEVFKNSK